MEREFGALKGLMGANGLIGDIMPDIGIGTNGKKGNSNGSCEVVVPILGCSSGCSHACSEGCMQGCLAGNQNG